ncbi:MAG: hypothetical protein ABI569_16170 [Casimicrobiaceae bacterium]
MQDIYRTTGEGYLEFSSGFFQQCMREQFDDPDLAVLSARYLAEVGVTATTRMKYTGISGKLLGLFHYEVEYRSGGVARTVEILVKSKTHYRELVQRLADVLVKGGIDVPDVAGLLAKTELYNTHMKEINVFRMQKTVPAFTEVLPAIYGTYADDETERYVALEEFLTDAYVMQDYRDLSYWTCDGIARCVRDFAAMHAAFYANTDALVNEGWLGKTLNAATMTKLTPLWTAYARKLRHFEGGLFDAAHLDRHNAWIRTLPQWWGRIDALPKTLIYNDAQIRNLAVRNGTRPRRLVLFDWECTSIQLPQRDIVEFLSYAIGDGITDADIVDFLEAARAELARLSKREIDRQAWLEGCRLSIQDLHVNRMACQLVLHITLNRPDIERVFRASMRILGVLEAMP